MEIKWIDPKKQIPPFDEQILVVLGGSGSDDFCKTWSKYVKIANVIITKRSPNDDEPCEQYSEFCEAGEFEYDDFQFYVYDYADYKYGSGDDERSDWFSDSISAWAKMPKMEELKA